MAAVRVAAKIKQLNDADFFLMDAKDIETAQGQDLQSVIDTLGGDTAADITELKQLVGNEAGTDPDSGAPIEASGMVKDVDDLQTLVGSATVVDNSNPGNPVTIEGTGLIKEVEDVNEDLDEIFNIIGEDAVLDDSDPDNIIEVSPATGIKKEIADLKESLESNICDVEKIEYEVTDFTNVTNVKIALDQLFEDVYYVKPEITSFTTVPTSLTVEIGSTVSQVDFTWAINKEVTSVTLTDCTVADATTTTATYATPLTSDKSFTLEVSDGKTTTTAVKEVKFLPNVYYGVSTEPDGVTTNYDDAFVLGLPSKSLKSSVAGNYAMTLGVDQFGFLAIPTSFGVPSVKIGGFDTELDAVATFEHTNASGYKQSYTIYKTGNSNLGSITMVVS